MYNNQSKKKKKTSSKIQGKKNQTHTKQEAKQNVQAAMQFFRNAFPMSLGYKLDFKLELQYCMR